LGGKHFTSPVLQGKNRYDGKEGGFWTGGGNGVICKNGRQSETGGEKTGVESFFIKRSKSQDKTKEGKKIA